MGHHNVSATISLKENEWEAAGEWMWKNRECYNGLSVLPYDGGTYTQAPFEDITQAEFNKRVKLLNDIDLSNPNKSKLPPKRTVSPPTYVTKASRK